MKVKYTENRKAKVEIEKRITLNTEIPDKDANSP